MKGLNLFLMFLFLPFVTAVPFIEFQNEDFQPGETIFATIKLEQGNFTRQISESDIKFFEGRKEIFIESGILFYNRTYYFYAYPTREGNFTLRISNILYKEDEKLFSYNIEKGISVLTKPVVKNNESIIEILSVKPGVSFFEKEPLIKIKNLGNSRINFTAEKEKISLAPSETKEFRLSPSENFSYFEIKAYKEFSVPVIFTKEEIFIPKEEIYLKPSQEMILENFIIGEKYNETIQLFNFGEEEIVDVKINSDLDFVSFEKIENISERGVENLSVYFEPENSGHFTGTINISYNQSNKINSVLVHLSLFVLPKGSSDENFTISEETCEEISGRVCSLDEICTGSARFTRGGEYCCLALCEKIKEENGKSSKWIIGVVILLVLIAGGYYFYNKSKKVREEKPEEKIRRISERYGSGTKKGV